MSKEDLQLITKAISEQKSERSLVEKAKDLFDKFSSSDDILVQSKLTNKLLIDLIRVQQERQDSIVNDPITISTLGVIGAVSSPFELIPAVSDSEIFIESITIYGSYPFRFSVGTNISNNVNRLDTIVQGTFQWQLNKTFPIGNPIEIDAVSAAIPGFTNGELQVTIIGEYRKIRKFI